MKQQIERRPTQSLANQLFINNGHSTHPQCAEGLFHITGTLKAHHPLSSLLSTSPNSTTNEGANVQLSEPVGDISHSNRHPCTHSVPGLKLNALNMSSLNFHGSFMRLSPPFYRWETWIKFRYIELRNPGLSHLQTYIHQNHTSAQVCYFDGHGPCP